MASDRKKELLEQIKCTNEKLSLEKIKCTFLKNVVHSLQLNHNKLHSEIFNESLKEIPESLTPEEIETKLAELKLTFFELIENSQTIPELIEKVGIFRQTLQNEAITTKLLKLNLFDIDVANYYRGE